jgi:molybdopterin synthase sulfur carrier subunit
VRARVHLASALREHAGGCREVDVDVPDGIPPTLAAVLDDLAARFPTLGHRLRDEQGRLRPHVNVFVGSENARDLGGVDAALPDGAEISVLPAVSGGAGRHGPPGEAFGACG